MKAGKLLLVLAAVGLLGVGSFALGVKADDTASLSPTTQRSERPFMRFIRGQIGRFMVLRSQLDLSDDQRAQIKTILQAHKQEIVQVVQPLIEKRRALREAVTAADPNEQAIRAASDDLGKAIGDAAVLASKLKQQISPILTDQQRHDLHDFRSQTDEAVDQLMTEAGGQK
jgi:Spy/CpxP family protein refolding chaperone